ncbi:MAG: ChbG/HpnK family deacetylase [Caldimonas sp.]
MTRRLALCADDFGSAPGMSEAIVDLAGEGRLSAIACLANGAHWNATAPLLRRIETGVDIGLHFNLTEGPPLSAEMRTIWPRLPSLARLIALAHVGRLPREALRAELDAQVAAFVDAVGAAPAFIDGHQHVHHLPGVRPILLDAIERLAPRPAVRNTGHLIGPGFGFKRMVIERTGGRRLLAELVGRGIAHNAALSGVYDFKKPDYRKLVQHWLTRIPDAGALLFCHPGAASEATASDPIAGARLREATYFRSAAFTEDLRAADVVLGRVWTIAPPV